MTVTKPSVGASSGTWGEILNAGIDALDSRATTLEAASINAFDYGVKGDGTTDDTTALNAAATAAGANGVLFLPPRTYKISGTVTVPGNLYALGATLSYAGTGTALVLGNGSTGVVTSRKTMIAPSVVCASRPGTGWDGSSIGVRAVNLNACQVTVPFVQNFETGLQLYGLGQGIAYCTVRLGALWDNHRNLVLDADATGWANQNTVLGGRLQQSLTGATDEDTTANQVLLVKTTGSLPNGNTFVGTSFEGDNPSYYRLDCAGTYNQFVNCRWENIGGAQSRVIWRSTASGNVIDHGYDAHQIVETVEAGAFGNEVRDRAGAFIEATTTAGQVIPTGAFTTINTGWTNSSARAPFTSANGSWTPRQGRWRITARVTFLPNATGKRQARLLAAGATTLDSDIAAPNSAVQTSLQLSGVRKFSGAESVVVQAFQDSGADLGLSTTTGYVSLQGEWLGP